MPIQKKGMASVAVWINQKASCLTESRVRLSCNFPQSYSRCTFRSDIPYRRCS